MEALRRLTGGARSAPTEKPEQTDLEGIAFAVTAAVVDVCESIASESPLALTIEDAHSLDSYSLNVLSALLSCGQNARLLILITTRDKARLLPMLRQAERVTWIPLRPLSTEAMNALIRDILAPSVSE